jgi:ATP-binding cassette, subfamily B, bacterial
LGAIEFRSVSFSYDGTREALSDVSAVIGPRETVGIIGPSGSGKSTFVQLLLGLREPTSGLILANGQPITDYDREFWARRVTFVPQQPRLVAGTIEDNVRFYRKWITREDVERACRLANLQPDIDEMPLGLDTNVGEQGSRLSGGQQQRLVIARA